MKYTKEELEKTNLFALRLVAREIGVKKTCALQKKDLIQEILAVQSGEKSPCFPKVGRKALNKVLIQKDGEIVIDTSQPKTEMEKDLDVVLETIKKFILKYFKQSTNEK